MDNFNKTSYYEIRVRGQLGEMLLGAFPGLRAEIQGAETVLAGILPDAGALYGVLGGIEALGLELLEIRRPHGWGAAHSRSTASATSDEPDRRQGVSRSSVDGAEIGAQH